jgi:hypothetical protein
MNSHLSHRQLLGYLDGEMRPMEARRAARHLHSCWLCRTEMKRIEASIQTIMEADESVLAPALMPPRHWVAIDALIARHDQQQRCHRAMLVRSLRALRPAGAFAVCCAAFALVIAVRLAIKPASVSAQELMRNVLLSEEKHALKRGLAVRERVRLRKVQRHPGQVREAAFTEISAWKSENAAQWDTQTSDSDAADLEARFRANGIPIDLPLSVASVEQWEARVGGSPRLSKQGDNFQLTYAGNASEQGSRIHELDVLIASNPWHIKQMTLAFGDSTFDVVEEDTTTFPIASLGADLPASLSLPVHREHPPKLDPNAAERITVHTSPAVLNAATLHAYEVLYELKADLGEPVTVTRSAGSIQVGLWELSPERKRQLTQPLQAIPGVQVLTAVPPAPAGHQPGRYRTVFFNPPIRITASTAGPDQTLVAFLDSHGTEEKYTRQVLANSSALLAHLYALRNLAEQFPLSQETTFAAEDRSKLHAMIRDHATEAAQLLALQEQQIIPLADLFHISHAEGSHQAGISPAWQDESIRALNAGKATDHLLRGLLATDKALLSPAAALPQIDDRLGELAADLASLQAIEH